MPLLPINTPAPRQKRDALDRIAQGVQIAQSLFQIPIAYQNYQQSSEKHAADQSLLPMQKDKMQADTELARAQAANLAGGGKPTAEQSKAATFAKRMEQAEQVFDGLVQGGFDRTSTKQGVRSLLPSALQSSELQQQEQAERNFINAVLRRESGAAISPKEFENAQKQYFPRAGDSPEVTAQKKANRAQAMQGIGAEAGEKALEKVPVVATPAPTAPGGAKPYGDADKEKRYQQWKASQGKK